MLMTGECMNKELYLQAKRKKKTENGKRKRKKHPRRNIPGQKGKFAFEKKKKKGGQPIADQAFHLGSMMAE